MGKMRLSVKKEKKSIRLGSHWWTKQEHMAQIRKGSKFIASEKNET